MNINLPKKILLPFALLILSLIYSSSVIQEYENIFLPQQPSTPTTVPTKIPEQETDDELFRNKEQGTEGEMHATPNEPSSVQGVQAKGEEAVVVRVADGDTMIVSLNGKSEKVRIIGIDSPEAVDPRKAVQCFGKEASEYATSVLSWQIVQLEADPSQRDRDRYGRLLRFVWLNNGTLDFGRMMIKKGYAHEYTYSRPYKYQVDYKSTEQRARDGKAGLWADNACN